MTDSIRRLLTPPVFPDDEQTRIARLLHRILLAGIGLNVFDAVLLAIFAPETLPTFWINGVCLVFFGISFWMMWRGQIRAASLMLCLPLWFLITYYLSISGGVMSPAFGFLFLIVITAAILMGAPGATGFGLLCIATAVVLYWAGNKGWVGEVEGPPTASRLFATYVAILGTLTVLMGMSGRNVREALKRARTDEKTLTERNQQLQREIAERERAEERFMWAFHANPTSITIGTLDDGRFVDVNDSSLKLFGYTREEMVGHTPAELQTWGNPDERTKAIEALKTHGSIRDLEAQFRRKTGEIRECRISLELIELGGEPHILGMVEDITERKQAEQRLRESEQELQQLSDAAFEGIAMTDRGTIILANQQLADMLGYEYAELIGMPVADVVVPESRELVAEHIRAGHDLPYDHFVVRKDGSIFPVEARGKTMVYNGRAVRVTAIRDLTERQQAEQQRLELALQTERLESFKEFLNRISHDLKTPLTVINTSLYLLERLDDPNRQHEKIEIIRQQASLVERFIQDLLTLSRLEHAPDLVLEPLNINQLFSRVQSFLSSAAEHKHLTLQLELDANLPAVLADEQELYRALLNLVENAVNYTRPGGSITISTATDDNRVIVHVADTGIGIPPQELLHIFERFYRAEEARQIHHEGTGLGLAMVKRIVEIHHGTIEVESRHGVGTTFNVYFPTAPVATAVS